MICNDRNGRSTCSKPANHKGDHEAYWGRFLYGIWPNKSNDSHPHR